MTNIREPILSVCELTDDVFVLLFDNFIEVPLGIDSIKVFAGMFALETDCPIL